MSVAPAVWQRRNARRWRLVGLVAAAVYLALKLAGFDVPAFGAGLVAGYAFGHAFNGFGWAAGWESRVAWSADQVRERVVSEAAAGAPAGMLTVYAAVEAEHVIAGHDGDARECTPCNDAGLVWLERRREALGARR